MREIRLNNVKNTYNNIFPFLEACINISVPSDKSFIGEVSKYFTSFLRTNEVQYFDSFQIAFEEALTNSMKHGNKYDYDKRTNITLEANKYMIRVTIEDEGDGFDYIAAMIKLTKSQDDIYQSSGRGLFLISMYTDDFYFEEDGRRIILIKNRMKYDE